MKTPWQDQFRRRMREFGTSGSTGGIPVSIKVKIVSGCFHREHSPEAYRLIDSYLADEDFSDVQFEFVEHESGPEILVVLAVAAGALNLAASIVNLITAIIKARSEGIKGGDRSSAPIELIVRGHRKDGEYYEEAVLRASCNEKITAQMIEDALSKHNITTSKKRKKMQRKSK